MALLVLCWQRLWVEWRICRSLIPPPAPWRCVGSRRRAMFASIASSTSLHLEEQRTWWESTRLPVIHYSLDTMFLSVKMITPIPFTQYLSPPHYSHFLHWLNRVGSVPSENQTFVIAFLLVALEILKSVNWSILLRPSGIFSWCVKVKEKSDCRSRSLRLNGPLSKKANRWKRPKNIFMVCWNWSTVPPVQQECRDHFIFISGWRFASEFHSPPRKGFKEVFFILLFH